VKSKKNGTHRDRMVVTRDWGDGELLVKRYKISVV
jgi:hypothetical protein